ncbi:hypothetical protein RvY_00913 [Ramazzottius varieornatus]|uniref:Pre-SET domain-containing protein n=1 Tax=Ramazzottius varieornatus TaxID=947166 RepID=A0A1D1ULM5_RAMVA|nr:hypothetical protein RvY_00913 [Ramazzottius varieornatus]
MKDPASQGLGESVPAEDIIDERKTDSNLAPNPEDLASKLVVELLSGNVIGSSLAEEEAVYMNGSSHSSLVLTNGHAERSDSERRRNGEGPANLNILPEDTSEGNAAAGNVDRSPCDSLDFALLCSRSASERIANEPKSSDSQLVEPKSNGGEVFNGMDDVQIMIAEVKNDYSFGMRSSASAIPAPAEEDMNMDENSEEVLVACSQLIDLLDSCTGNGASVPHHVSLPVEVYSAKEIPDVLPLVESGPNGERQETSPPASFSGVKETSCDLESDIPPEVSAIPDAVAVLVVERLVDLVDLSVDSPETLPVPCGSAYLVAEETEEPKNLGPTPQNTSSDSGDSLASIDKVTLQAIGLVSVRSDKRKQSQSSESEGEALLESTSKTGEPKSESETSQSPGRFSASVVGNKFPKRKVMSRQEADTIQQLKARRIECDCKEEYSLGTKGTLDRFTLDITNSWRDRKALLPWTPAGVKEALAQTVCQARMTCHGQTFSCPRQIPRSMRHKLFRCAANLPLISLCDVHVANLRNHHACPTCSIFCELGEFRACSATSGHLYHEACGDKDGSGHVKCVHCLKVSELVVVKIEDPGLIMLRIPSDVIEPSLVFTPRQPLLHRCGPPANSYHRDFPVGFRISCSYLPAMESYSMESVLKEVDMLERVEMDLADLLFCIRDGDLKGVLQFLLYPRNVEALYSHTDFHSALVGPLFLAISERQLSILSMLIQAGFPIDAKYGDQEFTAMEYAAAVGYSAAVVLLRKLDDRAVCSAALEVSFRKLVDAKRYDAIALLMQCDVLNFDRFAFSDEEIEEHLFQLFSSKNSVTITNCATCLSIVKVFKKRKMGRKIADRLLKDWGHDFALNVLRTLHFTPSTDALEYVGDNLSHAVERLRLRARGYARPVSAEKPKDPPYSSHRVVLEDLSMGRERHPVEVVNSEDDEVPQSFHYVTQPVVQYEKEVPVGFLIREKKCKCGPNGKCNWQNCDCTKRSGASTAKCYTQDGRLNVGNGGSGMIYECSASCNCSTQCRNRVTQRPSFGHFQVFKEGSTWGLRSKFPLPAGYFIGNFVGAMMPLVDVPKYLRAQSGEMIVVQCDMEGGGKQKIALVTRQYGNCTRFIGRAVKGNVVARTVLAEGWIGNLPNIALFTKETVPAFAPLVLDTSFCDMVNVGPVLPIPNYRLAKKL